MPHDFLAVEPCTDSRKSASLSGGGQHSSAMNGEGTMALKNTTETYGVLAKLLHWLIALMLVGMVIAGLTFTGMERGPDRTQISMLHKSMGLLVLLLMTLRLLWKVANPTPADPPGTPGWQSLAARLVHWGLYAAVFFQLTMGLLVAGQRPIPFFGLFEFGPLLAENEEQHELFEELHETGWIIIAALVGVHVLAALYHHFVKKDGVLKRMTRA
jgi:cytochrome b561